MFSRRFIPDSGFRRSTEHVGVGRSGPSVEVFHHPLFIRGRKDLIANIVRKTAGQQASVCATSSPAVCIEADLFVYSQGMAVDAQSERATPTPLPEHTAGLSCVVDSCSDLLELTLTFAQ